MAVTQRVTIEVPTDLLRRARRSTGEGITATVRRGLELVAARSAYEELRRLRGKVRLSIDVDERVLAATVRDRARLKFVG